MKLSKKELCIKLAEDYADRVARTGMNYDGAYEHYHERCLKRKEKELMEQYRVQGLDSSGFVI